MVFGGDARRQVCTPIPPTTRWQSSTSCRGRPSRPPRQCIRRSSISTTSWPRSRRPRQKHAADPAAVDAAKAQLATFQTSVDKFAAAQYMGGTHRRPGRDADRRLAAASHRPALGAAGDGHRDVGADEQLPDRQRAGRQAEEASAKSAADAKTAAEQAAAVRADLQSKQSKLQVQIADRQVAVPGADARPAGGAGGHAAATAAARRADAPPAADSDPAILAAPPEAASRRAMWRRPTARWLAEAPGGTGEGMMAVQAALSRIGSPYSWGASGPSAVRLLRPGDVGVPAGRRLAAALQPGAGPGRPAGVDGPDAAGRPRHLLLRRVACRPSTSATG